MSCQARCGRCSRLLEAGPRFQFPSCPQPRLRCGKCAVIYGPMLGRSLAIAAVAGTLLLVINHADAVFRGQGTPALAWKAPLTYLVPFVVATLAALLSSRVR